VLAATAGYGPDIEPPQAMLRAKAGHPYVLQRSHDLSTLQGDPDNLEKNLRDYVRAFSPNVRDIFERYKFEETILDLAHDLLLQVLQHFAKVNLHPDAVSNEQMGHLRGADPQVRRGEQRDGGRALHSARGDRADGVAARPRRRKPRYAGDRARGVRPHCRHRGHAVGRGRPHPCVNPSAQVNLLGQEINPASYAICKADMVVKGQPIDNIVLGNT
jgi:type I restriction enzyme M protein